MSDPQVPISSLPDAVLPLLGNEYVPFVQSGVTVKALLSAIYANVAGVSLLGPLELLSADGQTVLGSLGPVEDTKVGLLSADGFIFLVLGETGAEAQGSWAFYDSDGLGGGPTTEYTQLRANYYDGVKIHSQNVDDYSETTMGHFGFDSIFVSPGINMLARVSINADGFRAFAVDTNTSDTSAINIAPDLIELTTPSGDFKFFANGSVTFNGHTVVTVQNFATGSRPSATTSGMGAQIYDSTIHKPLWSDGTVWRDAMGNAV